MNIRCGSADLRVVSLGGARIIWGMPAFTDELKAGLDAGTVVLGGCSMTVDAPRWRCRSCGHELGDLGNRMLKYLAHGEDVPDYVAAFDATLQNRNDPELSAACGCIWYESVYSSREVREYVPDDLENTAVCPHCGHDTVIGDAAGYPLTKDFLHTMHRFWIEGTAGDLSGGVL